MNDLAQRAPAAIAETNSLESMAAVEGWSANSYALTLASHIRNSGVPLQIQTERLAALAQFGAGADLAAAEVLAQHLAVLESLHQRFAFQAFKALDDGGRNAPEVADRYLSASLRAQRAVMSILSALKVLRDAASTRPQAPALSPAPSTSMPGTEVLPRPGLN